MYTYLDDTKPGQDIQQHATNKSLAALRQMNHVCVINTFGVVFLLFLLFTPPFFSLTSLPCFRLVWNHWVFGPALVALIHNSTDGQPMTSCFIMATWETESDTFGRRDTIAVSPTKFSLRLRSSCSRGCVFCWYSGKTLKVSMIFIDNFCRYWPLTFSGRGTLTPFNTHRPSNLNLPRQ